MPPTPPVPLGDLRRFREPLVRPDVPVRETPQVSFGDLVRMLAEGIADAQASLDRSSAELVTELAGTEVSIVPGIDEVVAADGTVTYTAQPERTVSLLDLGVTPTFYAFSEATVEVAMDIKVVEQEVDTTKGKRFSLFAGTSDVQTERRLNRDVSVHSKLTATLVPVPSPLRLQPTRSTTTPT